MLRLGVPHIKGGFPEFVNSYTAKLSTIFTVDQLHFGFSDGCYIGSEKGGIDVIYGELPYMKLLMHKYPSQYKIRGQPNKTYGGGFGFAFPKGSPLVNHFSRAILNVTQSTTMTLIEQDNFGARYPSNQDSVINPDNPNLKAYNFGAKDHESNPTNQAKGSPSEAVNESQNNTNISNTNVEAVPSPEPSTDQDEANESEPTNTDVISSGLGEIQLSESRNVETPAAATGIHMV
ncbi:hypothetical protein ACH5RR_006407 [Cinchona calisaya]|uniref:Uncharacterized protein n=1 Tax=Cinchona calisaya TaxID=153742 RepID=A0ABD3ANZ1_9GENT